jgi:hypothetical protein
METRVFVPGAQSVTPIKVPRVRRALIEGLRLEFERFLEDADLGDLYLLNELLKLHNNDNLGVAEPDVASSSPFLDRIDDLSNEALQYGTQN